jgi:tRNA nucleotidyltransferase/poly(A) polymerase
MPNLHRQFAVQVVRQLREAGFAAYWAGGCVRDEIMGRTPKDYDVATNATPQRIRELFGFGRTLAIGVAFGVITVRGPRGAGQVEVTTFRRDTTYSDGRHPDAVVFSSPEEDASRRDFTINGLFFDPLEQRVIDFVGGQADLEARLIRAIGRPEERFAEDKLRLLRAIRFAAAFQFTLEESTLAAIRQMADQIGVVSPERIAMEMRRMLVDPHREQAVRLLVETGLVRVVLPEILAAQERLDHALQVAKRLAAPEFPLALAAVLGATATPEAAERVGERWRLSNKETERAVWLVDNQDRLRGARHKPWSAVQPLLIHLGAGDLLALTEARLQAEDAPPAAFADVDWCRQALARPREELNPPPLVTGDDLRRLGVPSGPIYRALLEQLRNEQLDARLRTPQEALARVAQLLRERQS